MEQICKHCGTECDWDRYFEKYGVVFGVYVCPIDTSEIVKLEGVNDLQNQQEGLLRV